MEYRNEHQQDDCGHDCRGGVGEVGRMIWFFARKWSVSVVGVGRGWANGGVGGL